MDLKEMHDKHTAEHWGPHGEEGLKYWRAWGSWFSWGSPVGMGLFIISIGVFIALLHLAGILA